MSLKHRIRRLEVGCGTDPDAWLKAIKTDELLFLLHHEGKAILADPALAAEDRASVTAALAALPPPPSINEDGAAALVSRWVGWIAPADRIGRLDI
jgi:hypothetical protein